MASEEVTQISSVLNWTCEGNSQIESDGNNLEDNLIESIQMDPDLNSAEIDNECKKRKGPLLPDEVLSVLVDEICSTSTEDSQTSVFSLHKQKNLECQIEMPGDLLTEIQKLADEYQHFKDNEVDEENDNDIEFHLVTNSVLKPVDNNTLIWLTELRNIIFQSCYYKYFRNEILQERLTRSKISRYVFDPKHRNLIVLQNKDVIGGICFRMYPTYRKPFSEIAFVAVPDQEELDDEDSWLLLGTVMMNHLKDYNVKRNIYNLLAIVPEEAIPYFEMQGFTTETTLPTSDYEGDIYVHEEDILMECKLEKGVSYVGLSESIAKQKWILQRIIDRNMGISFRNTIEDESNLSETEQTKAFPCASFPPAHPSPPSPSRSITLTFGEKLPRADASKEENSIPFFTCMTGSKL